MTIRKPNRTRDRDFRASWRRHVGKAKKARNRWTVNWHRQGKNQVEL